MSNVFSNFFSKFASTNVSNNSDVVLPTENTESITAQVTETPSTSDSDEITVVVSVNFNSTPITVKRGTPIRDIVAQGLKLLGLTVSINELTLLDTKTNVANAYSEVAESPVNADTELSLQQSSGTAG